MIPPVSEISLAGTRLWPDISGAVYLPDHGTLIVADLHLEKGSAFLLRGVPLPPFDTAETLLRLDEVVSRLAPKCVVALGDSFHDRNGDLRLADDDRQKLMGIISRCAWTWIIGNHDPAPPESLGGKVSAQLDLGDIHLVHEPVAGCAGQIAGHLHPVAKIAAGGRRLRRRCFVSDGQQMVLPAFGAYTGGLNVLDRAFAGLFSLRFHAWMIGHDAVYKVAADRLIPDS